jgi:Arc/MetJ family transcription regulator
MAGSPFYGVLDALRPPYLTAGVRQIIFAFTPLFCLCVYMRTNIDLDEGLVSRGLLISGLRTKKDLVNMALKEFIRKNDQKKILELRGKIHWQGDLELMRESRI